MKTKNESAALKAYEVRDNGEGCCCIVFATNGAAARREGASELDTDFDGIESCNRRPALDCYAPGPVPPMTLLDRGWRFECSHCGRRVSNDMADDLEDDGLDPADFSPMSDGGKGIYCSAACAAEDAADKRLNAEAKADLAELFSLKFPEAKIDRLHVYGNRLQETPKGHGVCASVTFRFPGSLYPATWIFGEPTVSAAQIDAIQCGKWIAGLATRAA